MYGWGYLTKALNPTTQQKKNPFINTTKINLIYTESNDYLEQFRFERLSVVAKPKTMQLFSSTMLADHSPQLRTQRKDLNITHNIWATRVNTMQ